MKVLHLPVNIASHPFETVKGLAKAKIDNKIFVMASFNGLNNPINAILIKSPYYFKKRNPIFLFHLIKDLHNFVKLCNWADVIHWYYDTTILPFKLDLYYIKWIKKPAIVEWAGSDIRIPEIEFNDNPYYTKVYNEWEYKLEENKKKSYATQLKFKQCGFTPLVMLGMDQYIFKELFPFRYHIKIRYSVEDVAPSYPDPNKKVPLIVHAPSKTGVKGTKFIVDAIENLKEKYELEFKLIHGMPREDALNAMAEADIVVDQLIGGHHGMATLEAMSYGKPTICFLKPSGLHEYPEDLAIIIATPNNIQMVLEKYICDGQLRNQSGIKSREYALKYHDTNKLAFELIEIYNSEIERKRK